MTLVVGYAAGDSGTAALELAGVVSRSSAEPLIIAVVVASSPSGRPRWVPSATTSDR